MDAFMILISIFMSLMVFPHVLRMKDNKSSKDQSLIGVLGVAFGIICWIIYGFHTMDYTIVWCNFIMLATYTIYASTVIYYRIKNEG